MTIVYDEAFPTNNLKELPKGAAFTVGQVISSNPTVYIKDDDDIIVSLRGTCYTSASFKEYDHEVVRVAISPIVLPANKNTEIQYRFIEDIELGEMFIYDSQIYMKCRHIDNTACAYNISRMELYTNISMDNRAIWAPFLGMHVLNATNMIYTTAERENTK